MGDCQKQLGGQMGNFDPHPISKPFWLIIDDQPLGVSRTSRNARLKKCRNAMLRTSGSVITIFCKLLSRWNCRIASSKKRGIMAQTPQALRRGRPNLNGLVSGRRFGREGRGAVRAYVSTIVENNNGLAARF